MTTLSPSEMPALESFEVVPAARPEPARRMPTPAREAHPQIQGYVATGSIDLGGFLDELCR